VECRNIGEVRFEQRFVDGLVTRCNAAFTDRILLIIAKLISRSKEQGMDYDCVGPIGHVLDFLAFSSEVNNLSNNSGQILILSGGIKDRKFGKEVQKINQSNSSKCTDNIQETFEYFDALSIENTFRPLIIENSTMILNALFNYGDQETHTKVIKTLLD